MALRVSATLIVGTKLHQLLIFDGKTLIGEYERAQSANIDRKKKEVRNAEAQLLDVFRKHGPFIVRWNDSTKSKIIRANGIPVGTIAKSHWETPSWQL